MLLQDTPLVFLYDTPLVFLYDTPLVFLYDTPLVFLYDTPLVFLYDTPLVLFIRFPSLLGKKKNIYIYNGLFFAVNFNFGFTIKLQNEEQCFTSVRWEMDCIIR